MLDTATKRRINTCRSIFEGRLPDHGSIRVAIKQAK